MRWLSRFRRLRLERLQDRSLLSIIGPLSGDGGSPAAALLGEFADPNPAPGNRFGDSIVPLSTGNVVITSPYDDAGGTDAGAVYLFNGATGELISTLFGSHDNDRVGSNGATALANGNFVVSSGYWNGNAGAVTFGDGDTGINGVVSAANSLVGSTEGDCVGNYVTPLANGNYVVRIPYWDNGAATNAGAVSFGSGATGVWGVVSSANSLIGSATSDMVGSEYITELANGNYLVCSPYWDNGAATNAGAVTFASGTTGITGVVSAANSLVGSSTDDKVGDWSVAELTNGNFVMRSPYWDNGALIDAGAATFVSGTTGLTGVISSANSLVGTHDYDSIGNRVTALANGNYVACGSGWNNGAGAATFGDGVAGVTGEVSAANSLIGSTEYDRVGATVVALPSGNYVVVNPDFDAEWATDAGAVTFGSGATGVSGEVSTINSLVGSTDYDHVGGGGLSGDGSVIVLSNGNYVVRSPEWDNGPVIDAGAVTFGSGTTGVNGLIGAVNSLVGDTTGDQIGFDNVEALSSGNYVVRSHYWHSDTGASVGAATFGDGTTGVSGVVSATNSLVGSTEGDCVGTCQNNGSGVTELANGDYVVNSPHWDNGATSNVGAVTLASGATGIVGVVSAANSLIGSTANDGVGYWVTPLSDGDFVVHSPYWDDGAVANVGAVTCVDSTAGTSGTVSAANSLVGSNAVDQIGGIGTVTALPNGSYVVRSPYWDNGAATEAGAVTFGNATTGVVGVVSAANSLVGSATYDRVGEKGVAILSNGNYVVRTPGWDDGAVLNVGAVTFGNATSGVTGVISANNSLIGSTQGDNVGYWAIQELSTGDYVVASTYWHNGVMSNAGAVTFGSGTTGITGVVDADNSAVGATSSAGLQSSVVLDNVNDTYLCSFLYEGEGKVRVGSQSDGPPGLVTLEGTPNADVITFEQVGSELRVQVNSDPVQVFDATAVTTLYLDGLGNTDTLVLNDTGGTDQFEVGPTGCRLQLSTNIDVVGSNFETTYATATGTSVPGQQDSAMLYGSNGSDAFSGFESYSTMTTGVGVSYAVFGFGAVEADVTGMTGMAYGSASGGPDSAYLYDSAGADVFHAGPTKSELQYAVGKTNAATGFRYTYGSVYNGHDGSLDTANLYGSAGSDTYLTFEDYSTMSNGSTYYSAPIGFGVVSGDVTGATGTAYGSAAGGTDSAYMYDSSGADTFSSGPTSTRLAYASGKTNDASGFRYLYCSVWNGHDGSLDTASLYGSAGSDTYLAFEDYSTMSDDSTYRNAPIGFGTVTGDVTGASGGAYGSASGGTDSAFMYDSALADTFHAGPSSAELQYGGGKTNSATGLRYLYCSVWNGHDGSIDTAYLYGSSGIDFFIGFEGYSLMESAGVYRNVALKFGTVVGDVTGTVGGAYGAAGGGTDYAYIYDSTGADTYYAGPTKAKMAYASTKTTEVSGVDEAWGVVLYGGVDAAYLYGSANNDQFLGFPTYGKISGTGYLAVAEGFDTVEADVSGTVGAEYGSASGGTDTAFLYDSALNDLYHAEDDEATMDYNYDFDAFVEILARGFDPVWAVSTNGGTDEADESTVNPPTFTTTYSGPWN